MAGNLTIGRSTEASRSIICQVSIGACDWFSGKPFVSWMGCHSWQIYRFPAAMPSPISGPCQTERLLWSRPLYFVQACLFHSIL